MSHAFRRPSWRPTSTRISRSAIARRTQGTAPSGRPSRTVPRTNALDRKSTRLNSSHSQISYAVFCLKIKVGLGSTAIAIYQGQLLTTNFAAFIIYVPLGLLLVAGFLFYRWRSKVQVLDSWVKISNTLRSVTIDYDNIRWVKALPLRQHFESQ